MHVQVEVVCSAIRPIVHQSCMYVFCMYTCMYVCTCNYVYVICMYLLGIYLNISSLAHSRVRVVPSLLHKF